MIVLAMTLGLVIGTVVGILAPLMLDEMEHDGS